MEEEIEMIYGLSEGIEQMAIERTTKKVTAEVTEKVTKQVTKQVTENITVKYIENIMTKGNMSLAQAMDILGILPEERESLYKIFLS